MVNFRHLRQVHCVECFIIMYLRTLYMNMHVLQPSTVNVFLFCNHQRTPQQVANERGYEIAEYLRGEVSILDTTIGSRFIFEFEFELCEK